MQFREDKLYHVYNRGNNQQLIFFKPENYIYFLQKVRQYVRPKCNLLAYCLMPNHFHVLLQATEESVLTKQGQLITQTELSDGFRQLLSSYALKDWPYSSFPDYANFRNGALCSKDVAYQLIDADWVNFIHFSNGLLPEDIADQLY